MAQNRLHTSQPHKWRVAVNRYGKRLSFFFGWLLPERRRLIRHHDTHRYSVSWRSGGFVRHEAGRNIGFSALLLDSDKTKRRNHNPLRGLDNIWAPLEVFNLIDWANTISYSLIKDFSNNIFNLPNRLTPRLINLKLVARW